MRNEIFTSVSNVLAEIKANITHTRQKQETPYTYKLKSGKNIVKISKYSFYIF